MPSVHSKPSNATKPDDATGTASLVLAALIKAGQSVTVVGELENIFVVTIEVARQGQTQGRGLHVNSVVDQSIRKDGYDYNRGGVLRLIEKPWTEEAWQAEIAAGRVPPGKDRPVLLRRTQWQKGTNGTARISCPDMEFRRFVLDDGNHRTDCLQQMLAEKHPKAIAILERGCILLDCDHVEDKDKMIFSSMTANNRHHDIDKDFLADKIGQIKRVRVFTCVLFHLQSLLTTQHKHYMLDARTLHGQRRRSQLVQQEGRQGGRKRVTLRDMDWR